MCSAKTGGGEGVNTIVEEGLGKNTTAIVQPAFQRIPLEGTLGSWLDKKERSLTKKKRG